MCRAARLSYTRRKEEKPLPIWKLSLTIGKQMLEME